MTQESAKQVDDLQIPAEFAAIRNLVEQFSHSRDRIENYFGDFLTELNKLRREIAYQELKLSKSQRN